MSRVRQSHCEIIDSESDNDVDHMEKKQSYSLTSQWRDTPQNNW